MGFKEVVNKMWAINYFNPEKPVPDELLREMIEMAAKAPSSFNLQPWDLIILEDAEEKMQLRKLPWDQDSGFIAVGRSHYDTPRAILEIESVQPSMIRFAKVSARLFSPF